MAGPADRWKARAVWVALFLSTTSAVAIAGGEICVRAAWIRAAPPSATVLAGYMTIENRSRTPKSLVGAASPAFDEILVHRSEIKEGVADMSHVPAVDVAAKGMLVFQPGGYHLMLMHPKRMLRTGDRVPVELRFADGSRVSARFQVREEGAAEESAAPVHGDHRPVDTRGVESTAQGR